MYKNDTTYYDNLVKKLKNNKVIAVGLLIFIIVLGFLQLKEAIFSKKSIGTSISSDNSTTNNVNIYNVEKNHTPQIKEIEKNNTKQIDITRQEYSFQLKEKHKGAKIITINNEQVPLLNASTKLNPRIQIEYSKYSVNIVHIYTYSGDTCIVHISNQNNSKPIRIIPNCI